MSKYNAKKVIVDGIAYDSKVEYQYRLYLDELLRDNKIKSFQLQPSYELTPKFMKNGKLIRSMSYAPDFLIVHLDDSLECVDVKGFASQASEMRKKLFDYRYPNIKLTWVSYVKKYGGFIEYDELKKLRKQNKKVSI